MKKGLIIAALLLASGSAFSADLSSVGSTNVEALVDYSYSRTIGTPNFSSAHQAQAGLQANLGGLGSFTAEAGDTQHVTDFRLNYSTFTVGYANGVHVGPVALVGAVQYSNLTGEKWFFSGNNNSSPINVGTGTIEANVPVASNVKLFADVSHSVAWAGNLNSFYRNAAVVTTSDTNTAAVGTYVYVTKKLELTAGYTRSFTYGNQQGLVAEVSYSF